MENIEKNTPHAREHLANERTFLAWIRTSLGVMAFGFVVEKFALFINKITYFLGKTNTQETAKSAQLQEAQSPVFGILLVGLGILIGLLALVKYKKVQKQIDSGIFRPSNGLVILLSVTILVIGIFLMTYLKASHSI